MCVASLDIGRMSVLRPIVFSAEDVGLGTPKRIITVCLVANFEAVDT